MDEVLEPQVSELVQVPELLFLVPEPEPEPELGRQSSSVLPVPAMAPGWVP
eukprot:COSAG06_NODE_59915_length_272_cov_1.491329_1_plen_50_part_01